MPNGGCLKCGEPILQGLKPHYCERCLAELGLAYDDDIQLLLKDSSKSIEADLEQFEFETATVTVERSRLCIQRNSKTAQQFIEPLSESIDLAMIKIPTGSFIMGSPNNELSRQVHEGPQHQVTLAEPFFMAKYPITKAQWNVVAALPEVRQPLPRFRASNRPVEKASWFDAVEFCARLSQHTGRSYRLPTEAEWEYACRGGTTTPFYFGETITPDVVNCKSTQPYGAAPKGESRKKTTDVGQFPANAFGLYDMHGNVWEWCQDHWHDDYDGAPTNGSAWLSPDEDEMRILRGGSYAYNPESCRSAIRGRTAPDFSYDTGLRVVCSAVKSDPSDSSEHESFDEMDIRRLKVNKQEWTNSLKSFVEARRSHTPILSQEDLSTEEEWQYKIIGGEFISWYRNHLSNILDQRIALRVMDFDPEPLIVFTSTMPGLVAAKQIIGEVSDKLIYLMHKEFEGWSQDNPVDKFTFHIHHWSYFREIDQDLLEQAQESYPEVSQDSYRIHVTGDLWGERCGTQGEHLWSWHDGEMKLLEEAFSHVMF